MFGTKIGWIFPIVVLITIIVVICHYIIQKGL